MSKPCKRTSRQPDKGEKLNFATKLTEALTNLQMDPFKMEEIKKDSTLLAIYNERWKNHTVAKYNTPSSSIDPSEEDFGSSNDAGEQLKSYKKDKNTKHKRTE